MSDQPGPSSMDITKEPYTDSTISAYSSVTSLQNDNSDNPEHSSTDNLATTDTGTDSDKKLDESSTSDSTNQGSSKSRELKSILALSKEANLKTNISHKRKKDARDSPRNLTSETEVKPQKSHKLATETKHIKFPVTAEAELEDFEENEIKAIVETPKVKRKRDTFSETHDGADFEDGGKRSKRSAQGEFKVFKPNKDIFCWRCHRENVNIVCETCPRSYHQKCLKQTITDPSHWPCPECVAILKAESTQTRSPAMKGMTLEHLCGLLKFAVNRMMQCQGSEPFLHPVSDKEFPEYKKYIIQPMDLTMLEKNIKDNIYGSTQAFEADAKWLLHNSIIFNSYQSKLTSAVKSMIKICKQEMMEIENCPSCYLKANTKKSTWFVEVCPKPHFLVWAKLKGFPYWPAKAMSVNSAGMVDVRFFGAHDRAWVHWRECFLYSEKDPNTFKQKRFDIEKCIEELNVYIDNLKKIYREFRYAPFRTPLEPDDFDKQLLVFLPKYKTVQARRKSHRESMEVKIEDRKESKIENHPKEDLEPEKSETLSSTHSNVNSPNTTLDDNTMEGYGTDDDMQPEIDHEGRKAFAGDKVVDENDDKVGDDNDDKVADDNDDKVDDDEEDEDDTQIPSNISVENTLPRGNVRTRGGFTNAIGKIKVFPRLSSENRSPSDDIPPATYKNSRRNSDQSVKSDSSRISNISDKINRVNISENMEITLGNEDVGCVSISENISPPNGENSRSGSEQNFEIKIKPVQVDIENAEFSISPNKLKISDQLFKRLNDVKKVEEVKKSLKDIDNIDKNKPSTSSTPKKPAKINVNGDVTISQDQTIDDRKENDNSELKKSFNAQVLFEEKSKYKTVQPAITEFMTVVPRVSEDRPKVQSSNINAETSTEKSEVKKPNDSSSGVDVSEKQRVPLASNKPNSETPHPPTPPKKASSSENSSFKSSEKSTTENAGWKKVILAAILTEEKASCKNSPSPEKPSSNDTSPPKNVSDVTSILEKVTSASVESSIPQKEVSSETASKKTAEKTDTLTELGGTSKNKTVIVKTPEKSTEKLNKQSEKPATVKIVEEFEGDDDEEDQESISTIESIVYDKKVIFDVIHSSLKLDKDVTVAETPKTTEKPDKQKDESIPAPEKEREPLKKRKISPEESSTPAKIVKLVSIESILSQTDMNDKSKQSEQPKEPENASTEVSETNIAPEDIKSEPDSEEEPWEESMLMEEKKKYLSALNIHEKTAEAEKRERNEIRTRSKAEEKRERFKVVDNLTRIIDDVALNYSALHDGEKMPPRKPERRKSSSGIVHEGEIYVKSFAKIPTPPPGKQRARKTFPMPTYVKSHQLLSQCLKAPIPKKDVSMFKKEVHQPPKILNSILMPSTSSASVQEKLAAIPSTAPIIPVSQSPVAAPIPVPIPPGQVSVPVTSHNLPAQPNVSISHSTPASLTLGASVTTSASLGPTPTVAVVPPPISMAMGHVILVPGSAVNYCAPINNTVLNTVGHPSVPSSTPVLSQIRQSLLKPIQVPNVRTSQNYIPHNDDEEMADSPPPSAKIQTATVNSQPSITHTSNNQLTSSSHHSQPSNESSPLQQPQESSETSTPSASNTAEPSGGTPLLPNPNLNAPASASIELEDEFSVLNGLVPESVSRAVSELLLRPPPRLRPRPPGVTSQVFDDGVPSSAGDVTTRINSIAHRMTDYFRGMLIETLEDIGKSTNPEAKIATLQLEMEALKHRHSLEMAEMRKNMCTILKDIQRSIVEEREKIVDETRAACEGETIRRVELAKSKQWCANCPKEAQFYCCWNTSYCDYPCQQKHWPHHAGKCTQSIEKATGTGAAPPTRPVGQPIVLRPTLGPKPTMGRIITKPTKVYMNKTNAPQKTVKAVSKPGLTLIETTPGNYELMGNGTPLGLKGKIITTSTSLTNTKYMVSTSSSGGTPTRLTEHVKQTPSSGSRSQHM